MTERYLQFSKTNTPTLSRATVASNDTQSDRAVINDETNYHDDATLAKSIAVANLFDGEAIQAARSNTRANARDAGDDVQRNGTAKEYPALELAVYTFLVMGEESAKLQYATDYRVEHKCGEEEAMRVTQRTFPRKQCVACGDSKSSFETVDLPCNHSYCKPCIQDLFTASFKDESLFPPRCCRTNKLEGWKVSIFLTKSMRDEFEECKVEFTTHDRVYCHDKSCSTFIPPVSTADSRMECKKCNKLTCSSCKQACHTGTCPESQDIQEIIDIAAKEGWRRCGKCKTMVELEIGCNHITCRCRNEFCYVCGKTWKTCSCPQWHESQLFHRAHAIANRDRQLNPDQQRNRVREATRMLRDRHECNHEAFQRIDGVFDCEECHDTLTRFIYRCRQCEVQVCWRCRHNRL